MICVAINGFGRIGKNFLRVVMNDKESKIKVCAINVGPMQTGNVAHFFKYDTTLGTYGGIVEFKNQTLIIDGKKIKVLSEGDPSKINWENLGVTCVLEASGRFTKRSDAEKHIYSGAKYVLISAPAQGEDITIVPGVNDHLFNKSIHKIISLGSCTTNAIAPVLKVVNDEFGIKNGFMTTVHPYTTSQSILDVSGKDLRRCRAAGSNII